MKERSVRGLLLVLTAVVVSLTGLGNALAAKPTAGTPAALGSDISWPQCGKVYPSGQYFGIVGVNGGLANNSNSCFDSELAWAQKSIGLAGQDTAALYVNTANPGLSGRYWPTDNSYQGVQIGNPYGTCDSHDTPACAYIYGYAKAYDDATIRGVINPSSYTWWLDVETTNSWETNKVANTADLEGMTSYFASIGVKGVGLYSTSYQWGQIVGTTQPNSPLNGLKSWLAGGSSVRSAQNICLLPPLTTGGSVSLAQFVSNQTDYNVACK